MSSQAIATAIFLAIGVSSGVGAASPEASSAVRIDTIESRFAFDSFTFESNPQTGAAAIRLEYSYPAYRLFGDETYRDPDPRMVMLPGLTYDQSAHEVVYAGGAARTVCAIEVGHRGLPGSRPRLKNTGACLVTARVNHHTESDGWTRSRTDTLDTYFEVRGQ